MPPTKRRRHRTRRELMHTATHEAGHAVPYVYLGLGLRRVTIEPDYAEMSAGHAEHGGEWGDEGGGVPCPACGLFPSVGDAGELRLYAEDAFWLRHAIATYAGAEAVRQILPQEEADAGATADEAALLDKVSLLGNRPPKRRRLAVAIGALLLVASAVEASPPVFAEVRDVTVVAGWGFSLWAVRVEPGSSPTSTGLEVSADLRPLGGPLRSPLVDQSYVCSDDSGGDNLFFACGEVPLNAAPGPRTVTLTVSDDQGRSASATVRVTVLPAPDTDGDGLPDAWEEAFGFDPVAGGEANVDTDGDGRTNLQEFVDGTHPRGTFARALVEGASSRFFTTSLTLFNPGSVTTNVVLRWLGADGSITGSTVALGPSGRVRFDTVDAFVPADEFATVIEADAPLVAERAMQWDRRGYGSHAESAHAGLSATWYFAEGATHGPFDLFFLLLNPHDGATVVDTTYLRPAPLPPLIRRYVLAPHARQTIWVDAVDPELAATDVAASFVADRPIAIERAMYASTASARFSAGHAGAGQPAAATRWYLAEGVAGGFFDTFLLVGNDTDTDATVSVSYLTSGASGVTVRGYHVPRRSRLTVNVGADRALLGPLGLEVQSDVPVFVERAMWWPRGNWYEGHAVAATTTLAQRWVIADGVASPQGYVSPQPGVEDTFLLLANPGATAAPMTITLHTGGLATPPIAFTVPARSRVTVPARVIFETTNFSGFASPQRFSAIVESHGPAIVVEQATYRTVDGVFWAAGSAAMATPLP